VSGTDLNEGWRPVLRALIETVLAFDHPAFPAIGVEQVERRLLAYFPLAGDSEAALRAALVAFDHAFADQAGGGARFTAAPLPARRAYLRLWARDEAPARRRFYKSVKSMVMITAYALPELRRAVGYDGGPDDDRL
jgi:gluconate 2-dehydrogenase subunit 3-like protein